MLLPLLLRVDSSLCCKGPYCRHCSQFLHFGLWGGLDRFVHRSMHRTPRSPSFYPKGKGTRHSATQESCSKHIWQKNCHSIIHLAPDHRLQYIFHLTDILIDSQNIRTFFQTIFYSLPSQPFNAITNSNQLTWILYFRTRRPPPLHQARGGGEWASRAS